ncbi:MAG: nucleotidyltransferase domain-containing protein [Armatimonadetes bacterium]|nr:nucleotidyltransferase domain-containing protein [Armatimonadota bacterium]
MKFWDLQTGQHIGSGQENRRKLHIFHNSGIISLEQGELAVMIRLERLPENIDFSISEAERVLARDDNVVFAYVFGGLSGGKAKPLSDIDISVFLENTINLADYKIRLFIRLADSLGTGELDLVILNNAPLSLAGRILQKKRILVDKEPLRRHLYESRILREFLDFKVKEEVFFARRYGIGGHHACSKKDIRARNL